MFDKVLDFIESYKNDKEDNLVILEPTATFREKSFFFDIKDLFENKFHQALNYQLLDVISFIHRR